MVHDGVGLFKSLLAAIKMNPTHRVRFILMAEKEGFEPSIPFWGIHDFQSCALGQLRDFSMRNARFMPPVDSFNMILQEVTFVKLFL